MVSFMETETQTNKPQKVQRPRGQKRKKQNNVKKITTIVIAVLCLLLVVLGLLFSHYWKSGLEPVDTNNKKQYAIEIPVGSNAKQIGDILEKKGMVRSAFVFSYYAKTHNQSAFQAGYYALSPSMTVPQVIKTLHSGGSATAKGIPVATVTIPEGYTVDQIADVLEKKTHFKKEEFLNLMRDKAFFDQMANKYPQLLNSERNVSDVRYYFEGYLYPATYNVYKGESMKEFVEEILKNMDTIMKPYYQTIEEQGQTVQHILTIASLVEKEGVSESDRKKIAGVFFNRIKANMPLGSDISVTYAKGEHKVHLSNEDVRTDSPYNLYVYTGYGPGPFNNPSKAAIEATVHPTKSDYLYFVADIKTGKVYFAKTYEEHEKLSSKYVEGYNNK